MSLEAWSRRERALFQNRIWKKISQKKIKRNEYRGPLAQLVERPDGIGEVKSSILLGSTKIDLTKKQTPARLRRAGGRAFPQGNATVFRIPPPAFPPKVGGSKATLNINFPCASLH